MSNNSKFSHFFVHQPSTITCCTPDCPRRTVGCHATCPDYKYQRLMMDLEQDEDNKLRELNHNLTDARALSVKKALNSVHKKLTEL